jgi:hypothetical protein
MTIGIPVYELGQNIITRPLLTAFITYMLPYLLNVTDPGLSNRVSFDPGMPQIPDEFPCNHLIVQ